MTREEARLAAIAKPRIKMLVDFRNDVVDTEWTGIDIRLVSGDKCGVGNHNALRVVKDALLKELDRQIEEAK